MRNLTALIALFLIAFSAYAANTVDFIPPHVPYSNHAATSAPGVGDDANDGYEVGSGWYDVTADKSYECVDSTVGAAVWNIAVSADLNDVGNVTITTPADKDQLQYDTASGLWVNSPESYGSMSEASAGSTITITTAGTYYGWTTATTGPVAGAGLVTFTEDATADRLTVGANGAGIYYINYGVSFTGSANSVAHCCIFISGVEDDSMEAERKISGGDVGSFSNGGIAAIAANGYVDMRCTSDGNGNTVVVKHVGLAIRRIK